MEINQFQLMNNIIYDIYNTPSIDDVLRNFFSLFKNVVPFSYGSFLFRDPAAPDYDIHLCNPICFPNSFLEAESNYLKSFEDDHLMWLNTAREPGIIRESSLIDDSKRLNSNLYIKCYRKFHIYDSMQAAIVFNQKFLGVLSLFRTDQDGAFTEKDVIYFKMLCQHLNAVIYSRQNNTTNIGLNVNSDDIQKKYALTAKEKQIFTLLMSLKDSDEICEELKIKDNTFQKHLQNIFRKTGVSSKWELLKLH